MWQPDVCDFFEFSLGFLGLLTVNLYLSVACESVNTVVELHCISFYSVLLTVKCS